MVILARVIADSDDEQVTLTALAVMKLADLLQLTNISLITQIGKTKDREKRFEEVEKRLFFCS